eukprot:TRINITY_DN2290_c0_g1_i1.p1 TRINITY_DN2290_c0_g1~~TRINITY_DN2290_c0_g1_i1.p1  ORF type:complete len:467 (-),score=111.78 TRINITY_DN2290_c0_g1_i1:1197-2396(-)
MKVIGIVGKLREGKSTFMNIMAQTATQASIDPFPVGSEVDPETRGIMAWADPTTGVVLLDTEGLDHTETSPKIRKVVLGMTLLLSTVFVLNTKGNLETKIFNRLNFVASLCTDLGFSETPESLPSFRVLLRDFTLDLGEHKSPDDYLSMAMEKPENKLNQMFPAHRRKCHLLPSHTQTKFAAKVTETGKMILDECLGGPAHRMNFPEWSSFLEKLCSKIGSSDGAYEAVDYFKFVVHDAIREELRKFPAIVNQRIKVAGQGLALKRERDSVFNELREKLHKDLQVHNYKMFPEVQIDIEACEEDIRSKIECHGADWALHRNKKLRETLEAIMNDVTNSHQRDPESCKKAWDGHLSELVRKEKRSVKEDERECAEIDVLVKEFDDRIRIHTDKLRDRGRT